DPEEPARALLRCAGGRGRVPRLRGVPAAERSGGVMRSPALRVVLFAGGTLAHCRHCSALLVRREGERPSVFRVRTHCDKDCSSHATKDGTHSRKHGLSYTPEYRAWQTMRLRCTE